MHILLWSVPLVFWCQSYISIAQKEEQDLHFQFLFDFLTWEPEILDCDISFVWKSDFFQDVVIALKTMELKENINR
uniref:Uncharacterized protein n=3 Tax=Lepeophtheirus salmonis TaxID=72036 RepID=A0A0K2UVS0_LEPSM